MYGHLGGDVGLGQSLRGESGIGHAGFALYLIRPR